MNATSLRPPPKCGPCAGTPRPLRPTRSATRTAPTHHNQVHISATLHSCAPTSRPRISRSRLRFAPYQTCLPASCRATKRLPVGSSVASSIPPPSSCVASPPRVPYGESLRLDPWRPKHWSSCGDLFTNRSAYHRFRHRDLPRRLCALPARLSRTGTLPRVLPSILRHLNFASPSYRIALAPRLYAPPCYPRCSIEHGPCVGYW